MKVRVVVSALTAGLSIASVSAQALAQDTTSSVTTTSTTPPPSTTTVVQQPTQPTVVQAAPPPVVVQPVPVAQTTTTSGPVLTEKHSESGAAPNRALLTTGLVMFGGLYVTSIVVGAESNHDGDHHLYVPLAGPWMDLGSRGGCPANRSCDAETTDKILLGVDGVFQALGALQIVGAFLFPETRTVETVHSTALNTDITFTPAKVGGSGYGLAALATF